MQSFRIGEAIKFGWEKFKAHFLFLWTILGITIGISLFFDLAQKSVGKESFSGSLIGLVALVVSFILELGLIRMYLDLCDDKEDTLETLFSQYRLVWRYFGALLLYGIMVVLGLILLIVPGIYLALKYQFFAYLIVDKSLGVIEALKKSAEMTRGIKWKLLGFSFAVGGLNLLGALALGVGLLVTAPVSIMAYVSVYRALLNSSLSAELSSEKDALAKETA